jgi:hypothetical protein
MMISYNSAPPIKTANSPGQTLVKALPIINVIAASQSAKRGVSCEMIADTAYPIFMWNNIVIDDC